MQHYVQTVFAIIAMWFITFTSWADPIQDLSMQDYQAGWYPNFYKGTGPMTCPQTCKIWVDALPESEQSAKLQDGFDRTHVCKITTETDIIEKPINDPYSHWLYGNQFDTKTVCYSGTPYGTKEDERYMCLCVDQCLKPDLIVSMIHFPVWDHSSGQSIITVDITNIGAVGAPASYARIVDTVTMANDVQLTPAIPAGGTVTITFTLGYWVFDPNAELEVTADYKYTVDECDETNNVLEFFHEGQALTFNVKKRHTLFTSEY